MKKKMLVLMTMVAAFALFVPSILAATEPDYSMTIDYGSGNVGTQFFANGVSITIEERTDGQEGALIKWEGGEYAVSQYSTVFGGSHDSETKLDTTSITMNGGTLRNIFGGGLHKSYVGTANVVVNGGTVTGGITGGGASSYAKTTCHRPWFDIADGKENATTVVDEVIITVNGGTISDLFAGGEGISYTKSTTVKMNGGKVTGYLSASGSNGFTDNTYVEVNNGTIGIMQGVNRGKVENCDMKVFNGTVGDIYLGAEPGDTSTNNQLGRATNVSLEVNGGKVTNIKAGNYGGNAAKDEDTTLYTVSYDEDAVENVATDEFKEDSVTETVNLTFSSEGYGDSMPVPKGFAFTQDEVDDLVNELNKELASEGFKFEGFYADADFKTKLDLTKPIETDTVVYMNIIEITEEVLPPKTSDINMLAIISMIIVAVVGAGFALRKRLARVSK